MTFQQSISNYILGNVTTSQLPQIAIIGLEEKIESKSLTILAGMNDKDNHFEIVEYYTAALNELKIKESSKVEAANDLLKYYLKQMIEFPKETYGIMILIGY